MYAIPFHRDKFRPRTIPGNDTADQPVEFDLDMAAGPDLARLKSVLFASLNTASNDPKAWSPDMQAGVIQAFQSGPQVFVNTVRSITNLTAPALLCRRVGNPVPDGAKDDDQIPITNGAQFSRVAPYLLDLALEVAFAIKTLTIKGKLDPRFSEPSSGSASKPASPNGTANGAETSNDDGGTAASSTPKANPPRLM